MELTTAEYDDLTTQLRDETTRANTLYQLLYYAITRFGFHAPSLQPTMEENTVAQLQLVPVDISPAHTIHYKEHNGILLASIIDVQTPSETNNPKTRKELAESPENKSLISGEEVDGEGEGEGATARIVPSPDPDCGVDDPDPNDYKLAGGTQGHLDKCSIWTTWNHTCNCGKSADEKEDEEMNKAIEEVGE